MLKIMRPLKKLQQYSTLIYHICFIQKKILIRWDEIVLILFRNPYAAIQRLEKLSYNNLSWQKHWYRGWYLILKFLSQWFCFFLRASMLCWVDFMKVEFFWWKFYKCWIIFLDLNINIMHLSENLFPNLIIALFPCIFNSIFLLIIHLIGYWLVLIKSLGCWTNLHV